MFLHLCTYLFAICYCLAFNTVLNIDEISSVHYNINILSVPVLKDQDTEGETVKLISKHGQEYVCTIPAIQLNPEDFKNYEGSTEELVDVAELLVPMEAAPCLVKRIHWWTYEFCYGSMIKQYHVEDNKVLGAITILGQYESEYNWKNSTESKNKFKRFHTQYYVNGTRCDLNGELRKTEVRFHCDDGASDYIMEVDEPKSCNYVVVIGTSRVCHHPYLQTQLTNFPYKLNCSPTLTAENFQKYQEVQAVKKSKAEELKEKSLTENETHNEEKNNTPSDGKLSDNGASSTDVPPQSSLPKNKKLIFTKESKPQMETDELPIHKHSKNKFEGLFGDKSYSSGHLSRSEVMRNSFRKVLETIKEEMENYRTELLRDYSEETANLKENDESTFFKDSMQTIKWRLNDLSHAVGKEEYDAIFEQIRTLLSKSLDNMLDIIKNTYPTFDELREEMVERVADIKKMVDDFMTVDKDSRNEKMQEILKTIINTLNLTKKQNEKIKERLKSLDNVLKAEMEILFNPDSSRNAKQTEKSLESLLLDEAIAKGSEEPNSDYNKGLKEKRKIQILKEEQMAESRKVKLEQRIKERLKKNGLDGQKIEIQIITPTYMSDDKYPTLVALSPKDEEILIHIVNSNEEELEERARHSDLVQNYNFQLEEVFSTQESSPTKDDTESPPEPHTSPMDDSEKE